MSSLCLKLMFDPSAQFEAAWSHARETFVSRGVAFIPPRVSGLSDSALDRILAITRDSEYVRMVAGLTGASTFSQSSFRGFDRSNGSLVTPTQTGAEVLALLYGEKMQQRVEQVVGVDGPLLCAVGAFNRYEQGDFMELHRDFNRGLKGVATLLVGLSDGYSGGQLLVYPDGSRLSESLRLERGAVALIQTGLLHEVDTIKSGQRETATLILSRNF